MCLFNGCQCHWRCQKTFKSLIACHCTSFNFSLSLQRARFHVKTNLPRLGQRLCCQAGVEYSKRPKCFYPLGLNCYCKKYQGSLGVFMWLLTARSCSPGVLGNAKSVIFWDLLDEISCNLHFLSLTQKAAKGEGCCTKRKESRSTFALSNFLPCLQCPITRDAVLSLEEEEAIFDCEKGTWSIFTTGSERKIYFCSSWKSRKKKWGFTSITRQDGGKKYWRRLPQSSFLAKCVLPSRISPKFGSYLFPSSSSSSNLDTTFTQ